MAEFKYEVKTSLLELYLSFSVQPAVISIDYKLQQLHFISSADIESSYEDISEHYYSSYNHLPLV